MAQKQTDNGNSPIDDPRAIEARIKKLAGVLSSRVITNRAGAILEIHVVAAPGRGPKQILRDIESTLLADEGIRIDRRKVSIAQLEGGPSPEAEPASTNGGSCRLRFLSIRSTLTPMEGKIEVTLGRENLQGFGKASFALSSGSERAVAEATLRAVERFIREGRFEVLNVENRPVGAHRGVFVHVEYNLSGRVVPLIGSALVHRDLNLAALHASLDAVNRFVGGLHPAEGMEWVVSPSPFPSHGD